MMRSLGSAVAGLKVHQTKMDVIGNNIANVNTVGFKSSTVRFSDILYQTTQNASGASASAGTAGMNAKQIGLGSSVSAITTNITTSGGADRTDGALDVMLNGDNFFIVNDGSQNYFTKDGSFKIDGAGNLCTSYGCKVMGWQVSEETGVIQKNRVSALQVMSPDKTYSEPEATTDVYITGNIDQYTSQLTETEGYPLSIGFYDKIGNYYTASLAVRLTTSEDNSSALNVYSVELTNVLDENGDSILVRSVEDENGTTYELNDTVTLNLAGVDVDTSVFQVDSETGELSYAEGAESTPQVTLQFDAATGAFVGVASSDSADFSDATQDYSKVVLTVGAQTEDEGNVFSPVTIDFSSVTKYNNSGTTNLESNRGNLKTGLGAGHKMGNMTGVAIDTDGSIYGNYDNGETKLLGMIATATFANPAGLEAVGNNMYTTTLNSGEFNGIGVEVTMGGGSITSGVLEMSNVDLAAEFTSMITTQRGFQANSRIITVSDTLLEELINLKR
jgi:flagellar hook protein FlgE